MSKMTWHTGLRRALVMASALSSLSFPAFAENIDQRDASALPSGQFITPTAPPGSLFTGLNPGLKDFPNFLAGRAVKTVVSPDGQTLLVMTSGYNRLADPKGKALPQDSNEYVFVFDITSSKPVQKQVIQVPNTYVGLAFAPDGQHFYASGGADDVIHVYAQNNAGWEESGSPISLGHKAGIAFDGGGAQPAVVANVALTADGKTLVAANIFNDSISVVDLASRTKTGELDLRPGIIDPAASGVAGGETPFGVAVRGNAVAYVSSQRDREIDVVDLATLSLTARIAVQGNPNSLLLNKSGTLLYAASDNSDFVTVIETSTNRIVENISTIAPRGVLSNPERFTGATPNALALSPDEQTLYVSDGGINAIAVVAVGAARPHGVTGLIPTGWYPNSVSVSADGRTLYDVNGKSDAGPNPLHKSTSGNFNQYVFQLQAAGLQTVPVPNGAELRRLTKKVAANNGFDSLPDERDEAVMKALRQRIKHVIYVVKENRTYDQVLGDLDRGNGDPALAMFGERITPNQHKLARQFVDLDNFLCSGEVSGNGWPWSEAARESDFGVKTIPLNYSGRGTPYDVETGQNRGADVGIATLAGRQEADPRYPNDPNLLPGTNDDAATDGPAGARQTGYIWDSAFRAGMSVRNYGFQIDQNRYGSGDSAEIPLVPDPFGSKVTVAYASTPSLIPVTDPYFRGYDNAFPDYYRVAEWEREFDQYVVSGDLPNLELVRLMHDHTGNFSTAIEGVNTPEKQVADNDYAVGRLIDRVAHSRYRDSTLIFVVEDDAQDGPDHVNAHRTVAFVAGPYVKQGAVVSTRYTTVNMLRTIEDVLGIDHLNVNDAYQRPMTDVFDLKQKAWSFNAQPSGVLKTSSLPFTTQFAAGTTRLHDAQSVAYWAKATEGYDWRREDRVPAVEFNRVLWKALSPALPYPEERGGRDYRRNRGELQRLRGVRFNYEATP